MYVCICVGVCLCSSGTYSDGVVVRIYVYVSSVDVRVVVRGSS